MNRHFSTLALSALALVAVGGLTLLRTGLVAEAARRDKEFPQSVFKGCNHDRFLLSTPQMNRLKVARRTIEQSHSIYFDKPLTSHCIIYNLIPFLKDGQTHLDTNQNMHIPKYVK